MMVQRFAICRMQQRLAELLTLKQCFGRGCCWVGAFSFLPLGFSALAVVQEVVDGKRSNESAACIWTAGCHGAGMMDTPQIASTLDGAIVANTHQSATPLPMIAGMSFTYA
jgi:hypothetical protein